MTMCIINAAFWLLFSVSVGSAKLITAPQGHSDIRDLASGALRTSTTRRVQSISLTELALVNVDTNEVIDISNEIVSLDDLPTSNLNVLAFAEEEGNSNYAVKFDYNGEINYRTERKAPYAFCGDRNAVLNTCGDLAEGSHTITATALEDGNPVSSKTISFTLVNGLVPTLAPVTAPTSAPVMSTPESPPTTEPVSTAAPTTSVPTVSGPSPATTAPVSTAAPMASVPTVSGPAPSVVFLEANENNAFAFAAQFRDTLYAQDTPSGIWSWASYKPHKANREVYPGLRGVPIFIWWENLEPTQGSYDWSKVDEYMDTATTEGLYFSFETWAGPHSPEWLYEQGVPKVLTDKEGWEFPYYFNELYLESFDKLNQEALDHILALSDDKKEALVMVVLNEGSTGDPYCYKGDLLDDYVQYDITRAEWDAFRQQHYQALHDYLGSEVTEVPLAVTHLSSSELESFIFGLFPDMYQFKNGMASHGYHIADEEWEVNRDISQALDGEPALGGTRLHFFGEMDREWLNGWFQRAPVESMYWSAIYALHRGLSRWQVRDDALVVSEMHFAYDFFNKYAPYLDAASSPYAFCALREGLDASDTTKFSESEYGTANGESLSRVLNILEDYEPYGALVEDTSVTGDGAMGFRQRSGYVDVFYGGVGANYHRFLYQIEPAGESIGWWHVGTKEWPYGRFARSFHASDSKTAMYFRLNDSFISDKSATYTIKVSITYFDEGNGVWELLYNDGASGLRSAATTECGGTQTWKKVQITLVNATLNGGLENGADFLLSHVSGSDTKFHLIELER